MSASTEKAAKPSSGSRPRISKAGARKKGSRFENEIAEALRPFWPDAKRGLQTQNRFTKKRVPDIEQTPFWIECQQAKKLTIPGKVQQAINDRELAQDTRPVLVVTREDNCDAMVTMFFWDFIDLMQLWKNKEDSLRQSLEARLPPPLQETATGAAKLAAKLTTGDVSGALPELKSFLGGMLTRSEFVTDGIKKAIGRIDTEIEKSNKARQPALPLAEKE